MDMDMDMDDMDMDMDMGLGRGGTQGPWTGWETADGDRRSRRFCGRTQRGPGVLPSWCSKLHLASRGTGERHRQQWGRQAAHQSSNDQRCSCTVIDDINDVTRGTGKVQRQRTGTD